MQVRQLGTSQVCSLQHRAQNNAPTAGLCIQSISPGLPKAFGIHGAAAYGMGNARQGWVLATGRGCGSGGAAESPPEPRGCSQHQQPRQNLTWHEQQGNSAWVERHSTNYIISAETLFKASKPSSEQEGWKGWNAKFLWEGICNLSNSAVISAWTFMQSFVFSTCGSSCLRFQFGLSALPCDQHRIEQAQGTVLAEVHVPNRVIKDGFPLNPGTQSLGIRQGLLGKTK